MYSVLIDNPKDDFELWRFNLRRSCAGEEVRKAASCLLGHRVALSAPESISNYDVALSALFISEQLDGNNVFRVRLPVLPLCFPLNTNSPFSPSVAVFPAR